MVASSQAHLSRCLHVPFLFSLLFLILIHSVIYEMISDTSSSTSSRQTIPISPCFSTTSSSGPASQATSDEEPDLGAFRTVFWALPGLQPPPPRIPIGIHLSSSVGSSLNLDTSSSISSFTHPGLSSATVSATEEPQDEPETVWAQQPIWQSYLNQRSNSIVSSAVDDEHDRGSPASDGSRTVEITSDTDNQDGESLEGSQNQGSSTESTEIALPVTVFSPNQDNQALSTLDDDSSQRLSSQPTLRHGRLDFPIHEMSTIGSRAPSYWSGVSSPANVPHYNNFHTFTSHTERSFLPVLHRSEDSEAAVQSMLHEATRTRSVVNDSSSISASSNERYDRSSRPTPDSTDHSLSRPRPLKPQPNYTTSLSDNGEVVLGRSPPGFLPQVEPPSPLPTPTDDGSETFPLEEMDDDVRTPTRPQHAMSGHYYPHTLRGIHGLPNNYRQTHPEPRYHNATTQPQRGYDKDNEDNDSIQYHPHTGSDAGSADWHMDNNGEDAEPATLGYLDATLSYVAEQLQRVRLQAATREKQRSETAEAPDDLEDWDNTAVEPKQRKRRRKKAAVAVSEIDSISSTNVSVQTPTRPLLLAAAPDTDQNAENGEFQSAGNGSNQSSPQKKRKSKATESTTKKADKTATIKPITILTRPKVAVATVTDVSATGTTDTVEGDPSFSLAGKKGKRVGRREREREKAKLDREQAVKEVEAKGDVDESEETESEDVDKGRDDEENADESGVFDFSSSSAGERLSHALSNISLEKKPRPGSPGARTPRAVGPVDEAGASEELLVKHDNGHAVDPAVTPKAAKAKKKSRPKRAKPLAHSKSYPNLRAEAALDAEAVTAGGKRVRIVAGPLDDDEDRDAQLDQHKRSRLIHLSCTLLRMHPDQKKELGKVINRLQAGEKNENIAKVTLPASVGKKKGHVRGGSKGSGSFSSSSLAFAFPDEEPQDPAEFDILGAAPTAGASLIHVFIDHSNILIGLLNYLKRHPPPQSVVDAYLASSSFSTTTTTHGSAPIAIPESGKRKRPAAIPIVESSANGSDNSGQLPFGTSHSKSQQHSMELSKSLPSESGLDAQMAARRSNKKPEDGASDGYDEADEKRDGFSDRKEKRFPRHLWHAALALILERGRPVSRRVVVTSSPLYQPMGKIEQLGYEVRVYIRVPDLGDGMDRKEKEAKYSSSKPSGVGKAGAQSSASKAGSNSASNASFSTPGAKNGHVRHLSGYTSTESGSGSSKPIGGPSGGLNSGQATSGKVKYREQGVDELLQLKLHQALADVDKVPKGSTIVLATGDGNVGQFNEDGFLGPVRTALKRGWKVELYAWEDGLSKSWKREFGESSEWGKKGLFRIIFLEQFAKQMVEAASW
ncbi:hypothetical protein FA15DRAFT_468577 [Coprinopsis marcescibilis]|uniref:NYN domain-containing protein n=1 Tax=Coprinopsis marcescibilis TaxID=230819 RepID=A0A5C3L520_COPMA|nr:hypothetical protein FA15DRAFT_468577 [Coprinopsis marcescibilis]